MKVISTEIGRTCGHASCVGSELTALFGAIRNQVLDNTKSQWTRQPGVGQTCNRLTCADLNHWIQMKWARRGPFKPAQTRRLRASRDAYGMEHKNKQDLSLLRTRDSPYHEIIIHSAHPSLLIFQRGGERRLPFQHAYSLAFASIYLKGNTFGGRSR